MKEMHNLSVFLQRHFKAFQRLFSPGPTLSLLRAKNNKHRDLLCPAGAVEYEARQIRDVVRYESFGSKAAIVIEGHREMKSVTF
jgi:hypothetical protein